jgi:3-dehydroquinate synthase
MSHSLTVELGNRSYDIIIGDGLLAKAGSYFAPLLRKPRVIVVTDETVAKLYLQPLEASLSAAGITHHHVILPAGEQTKSFSELQQLLDTLLSFTPDRNVTLIALGGGVIGDITGFAASILLRGVDFIQVPTTLLAQVDSSVGGKTGINTKYGKNLVGTFYQPRLVLADISTLATLPKRELLAGYAEVVKYGIINDEVFFNWLEKNPVAADHPDKKALAHMVLESCKAKAAIVALDERESGARALLNFGHTLGHALEAETGYSDKLLHGEAVALGMLLALRLSVRRKLCSEEDYKRALQHFQATGLPTNICDIQPKWNAAKLIEHCYHDKKAKDGGLTFILAQKIGKTFISHDITRAELEGLLAEVI